MEIDSIKIVKKIILMVAIVGFASVGLTGCGIGYCLYTHNYNGGHDYKGGDGYYSNTSDHRNHAHLMTGPT
jgi:hypothetical protein